MSDQLIRIAFESGDEATADLIDTACREALPLIHASWELGAPQD